MHPHQRHSLMLFPAPESAPTASPIAHALSKRQSQNRIGSFVLRLADLLREPMARVVSTIGRSGALAK